MRRYLEHTGLPFRVLVDGDRRVAKAYGVYHRIGFDAWNIARPALFLIREDRSIARIFVASNQREFPAHEEILEWITSNHKGH